MRQGHQISFNSIFYYCLDWNRRIGFLRFAPSTYYTYSFSYSSNYSRNLRDDKEWFGLLRKPLMKENFVTFLSIVSRITRSPFKINILSLAITLILIGRLLITPDVLALMNLCMFVALMLGFYIGSHTCLRILGCVSIFQSMFFVHWSIQGFAQSGAGVFWLWLLCSVAFAYAATVFLFTRFDRLS